METDKHKMKTNKNKMETKTHNIITIKNKWKIMNMKRKLVISNGNR